MRFARARGYRQFEADEALLALQLDSEILPNWKKVVRDCRPLLIPDTHNDPGWIPLEGFEWIRSYASAPIIIKGQVIGLLNLESDTPNFFTPEHIKRLSTFADQAAVAIEKARLYDEAQRLAITDGLTGIFNRRHLLMLGLAEFERTVAEMERIHESGALTTQAG